MSVPHLGKFVVKRPWLHKMMKPIASWYTDLAGYRKLGLKADDLLPEETEVVATALKRLSPQEAYDRVFRIRRAFQYSLMHQLLPKEQQTKPEEDVQYLSPIIAEIEAEQAERKELDNLMINKSKA